MDDFEARDEAIPVRRARPLWRQILVSSSLAISLGLLVTLGFAVHRQQSAAVAQARTQVERAARAISLLADARFARRRASLLAWAASREEGAAAKPGSLAAELDLPPDSHDFALVMAPDTTIHAMAGRAPEALSGDGLSRAWKAARDEPGGRGLWNLDGQLFEVLSVPLPAAPGDAANGSALLGSELHDVAAQIRAVTGAQVVILAGEHLVESTLPPSLLPPLLARLRGPHPDVAGRSIELAGRRYLVGLHDVPADFGGGVCRHVILQPLDDILAASRLAAHELLALGLGALVLVLATVAAISRRVSRPLSRLTRTVEGMAERASLRADFSPSRGSHEVEVLEGAFRHLAASVLQAEAARERSYREAVGALAAALDARDHDTFGHSLRVAGYALLLGEAIGLAPERLAALEWGALLHDIGKIAVPDEILAKPGRLDDAEWEVMRRHPEQGAAIVSRIDFLRAALPVVESHHEAWDGSGYPRGLAGEAIPIEARIFAVVDTYDALTTDRPYRRARSHEAALAELARVAGRQLDPELVRAFTALSWERLEAVRSRQGVADGGLLG